MRITSVYLSKLKRDSPDRTGYHYENIKRWAKIFRIPIAVLRKILTGESEALTQCPYVFGDNRITAITKGRRRNDPIPNAQIQFSKKTLRMIPLLQWDQLVDWENTIIDSIPDPQYIYVEPGVPGQFGVSLDKLYCRDIQKRWLNGVLIIAFDQVPKVGEYVLVIEKESEPKIRQLKIKDGKIVYGRYKEFDITARRGSAIGTVVGLMIGGRYEKIT